MRPAAGFAFFFLPACLVAGLVAAPSTGLGAATPESARSSAATPARKAGAVAYSLSPVVEAGDLKATAVEVRFKGDAGGVTYFEWPRC